MIRKLFALAGITAALALAGCNTVRGVGEDVQSVANAGDEAI
jgi:predicted small secreted protein